MAVIFIKTETTSQSVIRFDAFKVTIIWSSYLIKRLVYIDLIAYSDHLGRATLVLLVKPQ